MSDDPVAAATEDLRKLQCGPTSRFADWPNREIPNWRAGVYSVWQGQRFVYIGMAGRSLLAGDHETEMALASKKRKGLIDRLNSHASGRRSGDQFCIYVFDRLVLPTLTANQIADAATGRLSLDAAVREFVRNELSYRWVILRDNDEARALERLIQADGLAGELPLLNPRRPPA